MSQKCILYISPGLPVGGAEKFLVLLANAFCKYTRSQTVVSLSTNNQIQSEFDPSINIKIIPRKSKFSIDPLFELRKIIKTENPDIIFCINFFSYIFMKIARIGLSGNPKIIISYHSTIHLNKKEHFLHKVYAKVMGKNDEILTVSKNQAAYTVKHYGISPSRFTTIYNGVDTERWKLPENNESRFAIREKHNIPQDAKVLVMAAKFRPEKNHEGAIKALSLLHKKFNSQAYLLLVGDGPLFDSLQKSVTGEEISAFIKFAGLQNDVRPFYWASDLFTLTSKTVETFSIAALEAMACGLPCVLTDIGGADEMIFEGKTGYLCKPTEESLADAWQKGLNQIFSKQTLHTHVKDQFSADKMIEAYKSILL